MGVIKVFLIENECKGHVRVMGAMHSFSIKNIIFGKAFLYSCDDVLF